MKKFLVLVAVVALMAGTASGAYYDNDGDSWETAYVIASSEDLMLMRNRVNSGAESDGKYYRLSADIDLTSVASWQSIGGTSRNFAGHFDGQGHTVALGSGGKLFGSISADEGTIAVRNLNLSGKIESSSSLATDLYSGIIESCSFAGSVSNTTLACGLVSQIWGGTIRNCTVSADVSSTSGDAGGIVGLMSGGTAQNCTIKAGTAITASENAGGIAGNMIAGTVTNCTVEAGTAVTAQRYAGGIAGYAVNDAVFSGNNYPSDYTMIGNIPYWNGDNDGSSWEKAYVILSSGDLVVMHDRINAGSDDEGKYYKLSADIDLTSITSWRGIGNGNNFTGHFDGQSHAVRLNGAKGLFDTINADEGTIAVRNLNLAGTVASENDSCAALVMTLRSGIIENCSFTGTVRAEASYSGGLVGWMSGGTARNCTVSGDVFSGTSGENDFAGGIAGYIESGTVENCTVKAGSTITASGEAGGIAGFAEAGAITNCTVEDGTAITSSGHAGGIVGDTNTATLSGNTWPSRYVEVGSSIPDTTPQITWNGHRYQAYNENLTWEEAKSRCESLGGHLATITSSLEQEQAETLLRQSRTTQGGYWLGASADVSGFWKWTTDEEFERQYTNFPGGQQESSGNYLYMIWSPNSAGNAVTDSANGNPGEWDCAGNSSYGFICEWDEEQEAILEATTNSDFQRWQQDPDAYNNTEQSGVPAGSNPSPVDTSHLADNPPNVEVSDIPVSFDARKEGRLLPVREQGIYQTCWAFAALGAMEADYMTSNMASLGTSPDLSELHLAWFAYKDPSSDSYREDDLNVLMEGAGPEIATSFLTRSAIAPVNEENMPYTSAGNIEEQANQNVITFLNGRTAGSFIKARIGVTDVSEIDRIPQDGAETINTIKAHIMQHGAVYFSYENEEHGYNDDKTSFYSENRGSPHAALLVGWDDNYPASNFRNTPPANGAWLVRTSRWADDTTKEIIPTGDEHGCFWMSYSQAYGNNARNGFSGIRLFTVSEDKSEVKENGGGLHTKDITSAWAARIFRASRNERLLRLGFHTTDNNAQYQIFINSFGAKEPTDPGRAENPVLSGDISFAGYHTLTLPQPVDLYEDGYYAVIVKMTMSPYSSYRYPTAAETSLDKYIEFTASEGESFFADGDGVPSVWQDGLNAEGGSYKACIMTFTEARTTFDTAPSITTSSLPDATVGQQYSFMLSSSGTQAIEWRSGNIPEDFTLSRTGTLTGQPQEAGRYDINLTAVNDVGYVEKVLSLTVNAATKSNDPVQPEDNTQDTKTDDANQEQNQTPADDNTQDDTQQNDTQQEDETPSSLNASGGGCDSVSGLAVVILLAGVKRWRRK